jgi:ABC-type multidrug transport system fused ATPase/permease subunit
MALLIVAHRMTTVAMCDRVLVFEHGNLSHDTDPETALEDSEFFSLASDIAGSG